MSKKSTKFTKKTKPEDDEEVETSSAPTSDTEFEYTTNKKRVITDLDDDVKVTITIDNLTDEDVDVTSTLTEFRKEGKDVNEFLQKETEVIEKDTVVKQKPGKSTVVLEETTTSTVIKKKTPGKEPQPENISGRPTTKTETIKIREYNEYPEGQRKPSSKKPTESEPSSINKRKPSKPNTLDDQTDEDSTTEPFYLNRPEEKDTSDTPKSISKSPKEKPPFVRSETYEERCMQILGMVDNTNQEDTIETVTQRNVKQGIAKQTVDLIDSEQREIVKTRKTIKGHSPAKSPERKPNESIPKKSTHILDTTAPDDYMSDDDQDFIQMERETASPVRAVSPRKDTPQKRTPTSADSSPERKTNKPVQQRKTSAPKRVPSSTESSPDRKPSSDKYVTDESKKNPINRSQEPKSTPGSRRGKSPEDKPILSGSERPTKPRDDSPNKVHPSTTGRGKSPENKPTTNGSLKRRPSELSPERSTKSRDDSPNKIRPSENKPTNGSMKRKPADLSPERTNKPRDDSPTKGSPADKTTRDNSPGKRKPTDEPGKKQPSKPTVDTPVSRTNKTKTTYLTEKETVINEKKSKKVVDTVDEDFEFVIELEPTKKTTKPSDKKTPQQLKKRTPDSSPDARKIPSKIGKTPYNTSAQTEPLPVSKPLGLSPDSKHITVAKINLSPTSKKQPKSKPNDNGTKPGSRKTITTTTVTKVTKVKRPKTKRTDHSDYSSESDSENDSEVSEDLEQNVSDVPQTKPQKKPITDRKMTAPVTKTTKVDTTIKKVTRASTSDGLVQPRQAREKVPTSRKPTTSDDSKTTPTSKSPTKPDSKRPTKCITTKTINLSAEINTMRTDEYDNIIIDIQQAKSSREPTPNRIVPIPASPEDDTGKPRYPDKIVEPEDVTQKRRPKVQNIPIFEEETNDFVGCQITEIDEDVREHTSKYTHISDTKHVTETDECLLSVSDKVSKFSSVTDEPMSPQKPKTFTNDKPRFEKTVDEDLRDDECLLSVHDKVSKFIATAEEIKKPKTSAPFQPLGVRPEDFDEPDDCLLSVTDKVTKFINTAEDVKKTKVSTTTKTETSYESVSDSETFDEEETDRQEPLRKITKPKEPERPKYKEQPTGKNPSSEPSSKDGKPSQPTQRSKPRETEPTTTKPKYADEPTSKNKTPRAQEPVSSKFSDQPKDKKPREPETRTYRSKFEDDQPENARNPRDDEPRRSLIPEPKSGRPKYESETVLKNTKVTEQKDSFNVSDKVSKFITTAEKLTSGTPQKSPELVAKIVRQVSKKDTTSGDEPSEPEENTPVKRNITDRYVPQEKPVRTQSPITLRSTDAVKKAKAVFENGNNTSPKQRDILSRPSIWEQKRATIPQAKLTDIGVYKRTDDDETVTTKKVVSTKKTSVVAPETKTSPSRRVSDTTKTPYDRAPTAELRRPDETPTSELRKPSIGDESPTKTPFGRTPTSELRRPRDEKSPTSFKERPSQIPIDRNSPSPLTDIPKSLYDKTPSFTPVSSRKELFEKISTSTTEYTDKRTSPTAREKETSPYRTSQVYVRDNKSREDEEDTDEFEYTSRKRHSVEERRSSKTIDERITEKSRVYKEEEDETYTNDSRRPSKEQRPRSFNSPFREERFGDFASPTSDSPSRDTPTHGNKPSYMAHTIASLEHIRRDSIEINKSYMKRSSQQDLDEEFTEDESPKSAVKFGVELKRTNSERSQSRRKSSTSDIPHIEDIYELDLLETMMETVVGYEQRRRIRSQIRLVKRLIDTDQLEAYISVKRGEFACSKITTSEDNPIGDRSSPRRDSPTQRRHSRESPFSDRQSPSRYDTPTHRRTSHESPMSDRYSPSRRDSPSYRRPSQEQRLSSPKRDTPVYRRSSATEVEFHTTTTSVTKSKNVYDDSETSYDGRQRSPSPRTKYTSKVTEKNKPTNATPVKKTSVTETVEKPIWATKNILKKPTETNATYKSSVAKKTTEKVQRTRNLDTTDDCITSSYGIGPTDDDGRPLFGIRALKKKAQPNETTKVTGTIIKETMYSENGSTPKGERVETHFSSDPTDFDSYRSSEDRRRISRDTIIEEEKPKRGGLASITKTKRIGGDQTGVKAIDSGLKSKVVRRGSVKEMSEKFIKKEATSSVTEKTSSYPKAGLIYRTQSSRDTTPGASSLHSGSVEREEYEVDERGALRTTTTRRKVINEGDDGEEYETTTVTRSFLNDGSKVSGVQDVLQRMKNADNVEEPGDSEEDKEARALLNKFLGASVLMSGVESMVPGEMTKIVSSPKGKQQVTTTRVTKSVKSSSAPEGRTSSIEDIWDEKILRQLIEKASNYEERRKLRARLRQVMAEKEETTVAETREQSKGDDGAIVTTTTKVTTRTVSSGPKPMSPFAKFRQLDKQNSLNSPPNSPKTPTTPQSPMSGGGPLFKFTDPSLNMRAATIKDILLQWCQSKTKEYENVQVTNFSTCWSDGLAFCALIHHFLPDAFDYNKLTPDKRKDNFTLAFRVADEQAGIAPLLDVEDMVVMRKPDWKCVFTYVQTIYRRFRDVD